ncbi:integrase arm-type DNA-binding domain-containing protein [Pseudomonas sp. p1(2021b)]|uniref:tyrosine-type recombinase/integrase n=1 Tax=Pseudomonas sp. p1(2021b) TaxID=2874628 RepID=UPI001CCF4381|nr:DUF4102 domain-containing protein [Pseudomonas sp. p1(2021b)]UBM27085.1 integrase arm-type DNA-binding domain-containing protein [Pseudomonas sp. p1(2021b)]
MARGINKLSALAVQKAKDPGYYGDGGGLWLQVSKLGGKSWVFRYTRNGKTHDMGLGPVHTVSLSEARSKSLEHRKSLLEGIDPLEAKKAKQQAAKLEAVRHKTFKECAPAYIQANRAGWKTPKHVQQWENTLEAYAYPIIGELAIGAVDTNLVLKVLQQQVGSPSEPAQFWYTKAETASRLRGRIENILDWATFRGYRQGENPARWKGHLEHELPARSKVQKVEHHASLPYAEAPAFMRELGKRKGVSARGIVAVDEDVDPTDMNQVLWAMATRATPSDDIDILRNTRGSPLDPAQNPPEKRFFGSKALINACKDYRNIRNFPVRTLLRPTVYERVRERWSDLGLPGEAPVVSAFDNALDFHE